MEPILICMCGLQGSGKSYKAKQIKEDYENTIKDKRTIIVSSDQIRKDHPELDNNEKVFKKVYADINYWLRQGDNVIFDATNVTMKSRRQIFNNVKEPCYKHCYIMNTPFSLCELRINSPERDHDVPYEVLQRYQQSFEIPFYEEGWDLITLNSVICEEDSMLNRKTYLELADGFNQKNKHHTQDLGKHMLYVGDNLKYNSNNKLLILAGYYHDVGKLSTQSVGEDGNCHYYNHANVGAYNLMCCCSLYDYFGQYKRDDTLKWLFYINYHMILHNSTTEKSINKYKNIFKDLYNDLRVFETVDKMRP